jgi:Spy/CpxP family protein refolding chaperone
MRLTVVTTIVVLAVFAAVAIAQPAPAPGPAGPGPGMRGAGRGMNTQQMFDEMATRIGLTATEKTATQAAIREKMTASQALGEQLRALGEVARKPNATDAELKAALTKYESTLAAYRKKVAQIDSQLSAKLSLKARVALTALGVLDNGLGPRFGGGMGPGGAMGGRRMRMGGGGGGAPAPQ